MENRLEVNSTNGNKLYVFLYRGFDGKGRVVFKLNDKQDWSPYPFCYRVETFMKLKDGLCLDGNYLGRLEIDKKEVRRVKRFIQSYKWGLIPCVARNKSTCASGY